MIKKVNGKSVNISNIELFESAFEGLVLKRLAASYVTDTISSNTEKINTYISTYESIYKSLPFPLYCAELDVKHAAIGICIKDKLDEPLKMWVDSALFIQVEDKKAIKFVGNSWALVSIQKAEKDNSDIENYKDELGYKEFVWVVRQIMNGASLASFYNVFMKEFVDACNKDPMILKWELGRILEFGPIPDRLNLKDNRLLDVNTKSEYFLDIYSTGKKKTNESELVLSIGGPNAGLRKQNKYIKTYDFELYEKKAIPEDIMDGGRVERLQKANMDGVVSIFETLYSKGLIQDGIDNVCYKGIIVDNTIMYNINGQIYVCTTDNYTKGTEIAKGTEIFGYENNFVYLLRKSRCESGVQKESIFAYNIKDGSIRLCKIQYC